jgi:hypothetical protein
MAIPSPLDPPTDQNKLSLRDIAVQLEAFYQAPASISKYGCYLYLLYFDSQDFLRQVGSAINYKDTDVSADTLLFQADGGLPAIQDVQLFVHSISALETSATAIFSGSAQNYQVFIALDRISRTDPQATILVPYQTAKLLSSAFIYGLTTRLILERYKDSWQNASSGSVPLPYPLPIVAAPPTGGQTPHPVPAPLNAADWCHSYLSQLSTLLATPGTWTAAGSKYGTQGYSQLLSLMTDSSLQAVGIMMGWLAGDALTDGSYGNSPACQAAFWKILHKKYTTVEIGMMVGYTFTYLSGFLSCERMKAMIAGTASPPTQLNDPIKAPALIYNYLNSGSVANKITAPDIANQLFLFIVQEFYAIAADVNKAQQYQGFIQGFERGLVLGADVMYQLIFTEAYELGFTTGFEEGYAQGYSAGWTAGVNYVAGQNTWMTGLSNILGGLSQVLSDANSLLADPAVGTIIATLWM